MDDNSPVQNRDESENESLKKTTRILFDDAFSAKPAPKKATTSPAVPAGEKKATGPIMGIPTHTTPIPQTIRLKRPSTSPIVISPDDITTTPTVVKTACPKSPSLPAGESATVIKKTIPQMPLQETSRIILELEPQADDMRQKTAPIPGISAAEPTPGPKTIRLKRPSAIIAAGQPEEKQALSSVCPPMADFGEISRAAPEATRNRQATQSAKKSETAKIELPEDTEYQTSASQRKTIKIKRTDRNIIARTVTATRQIETKPQAEAVIQKKEQVPQTSIQDEPLPVFSVLAGLAAACLALLLYLLTAQAFGPKLILPVPSGLF